MKLLTRSTLTYLIITLVVFVIGGFIFYHFLRNIIDEEATEELFLKKEQVIDYVKKNGKVPESISVGDLISSRSILHPVKQSIKDTLIFVAEEEELMPFRLLIFNVEFNGQNYETIISKPMFQSDDLIETITTSFLLLTLVLIVILLLSNFIISKNIWKSFFLTIEAIKNYEIEKHKTINFKKTSITEFSRLNEAIHKMTSKISSDFNNLKTFSENASHELQTPLAVIKTKSELMLQSQGLTDEQAQQLIDINQTATKTAKLNQTLLLLCKIENNQFTSTKAINFSEIIKKKIDLYNDLAEMKNIIITSFIQDTKISIHAELADIIASNLLSNALKYTPDSGIIEVKLCSEEFKVSNTGKPLRSQPEQLFSRFYKENPESESTGLGLALVKQIALLNNHTVNYCYENGMHHFIYSFLQK